MICILIGLSFLFEAIMTNIVHINTLFTPLFLITSLVILFPYFKSKTNFIICCMFCGLLYDISFTDSVFINAISFGICGYFIMLCHNYFKYSIYSSSLINLANIIIYRIISYILLIIVGYLNFNIQSLLEGIYNSILINIIYGMIIYFVADLISKVFNIKRD